MDKSKHNVRIKYYGDHLAEVMYCDKPIFNDGSDPQEKPAPYDAGDSTGGAKPDSGGDNERSRRRARKMVFDLVACNPDLDIFVTLTLNKEKIDRYDYTAVYKKLRVWLDNRVRRRGMKYVMVAEHHKDGAIHFHALVNRSSLKLEDSGRKDSGGHTVYNLPDWSLGFTTAIETYGSTRTALVNYVVKYICKASAPVGGRWYYSGGDLSRPTYQYSDIVDGEVSEKLAELAGDALPEMGQEFTVTPEGTDMSFTIIRTTVIR